MCVQQETDKEEGRELTPDEIGRKIASQWTTDPDAAGSADSSAADEEELGDEEEERQAEEEVLHHVPGSHDLCMHPACALITHTSWIT